MTTELFQQWQDRTAKFLGTGPGLLTTTAFIALCFVVTPWAGFLVALQVLTTVLSVTAQYTGQLVLGAQTRQQEAQDAYHKRQEDVMQDKLNELIRAVPQADNQKIGTEQDCPNEDA
jgi:low affinity Fe/Cu permease